VLARDYKMNLMVEILARAADDVDHLRLRELYGSMDYHNRETFGNPKLAKNVTLR
jgi:hypothetical protein